MKQLIGLVARFAGVVASIVTALMMVHVTVGVVMRVVFDDPLLGTSAIVSYFYMVSAVFTGIFVAAWNRSHIRVDVIADLFPKGVRRVTDLIADLISLAFFAAFAWGLSITAVQQTQQHEQVDAIFTYMTVWPMRWLAVAAIALTALVCLWRLLAGGTTHGSGHGGLSE